MKTLQCNTPGSKVANFLEQMKINAQDKAKQMAKLELSVWDDKHEADLKADFGFDDQTVADRKKELTLQAA